MSDFDCVVIGGGVSGLVSATCMAQAGRRTLLLEATERLGGCIHSWRPDADFWLELGAHTAYNSYAPLLRALAQRGHLDDLLLREKLSYRFLQPSGGTESPMRRLSFIEAALSLPFGLGRAKRGQSVAQWFSRALGKGNYRKLLAPAFAAVLSQPADNFPADWLFRRKPRMKTAPRKYTYAGGLQGLLEALAQDAPFELRRGCKVSAIERTAQGYQLHSADHAVINCRQIILATPVDAAASLIAGIQPEVARTLQTFPMSSSEAFGVVVDKTQSTLPPVAGLIGADDAFWSVVTRDPVAHARYRGFTFHFRPGLLDAAQKRARVAAVLGVTEDDFLFVAETVNRLPAPGVEHPERIADIDARLANEPLALVGNYLNGLSIGDCAERAERECARLCQL